MLLKELKTTDFDPRKKYTFVIAMGATEQHGPFLPMGTDTYCQDAILEKVIKECKEAVFLPTLEITCSKEHKGFAGTVWIEKETMLQVLFDICTSLKEYAKNIILTSWHGGNIGTIDLFIKKEQQNFSGIAFYHVNLDPEEVLEKTRELIGGPVDDHAGNTEISMTLATKESLVKIPPKNYPKQQITMDWDSENALKSVSSDGIVDNHPQWIISREQGKIFIEMSADVLIKEIQRILKNK